MRGISAAHFMLILDFFNMSTLIYCYITIYVADIKRLRITMRKIYMGIKFILSELRER